MQLPEEDVSLGTLVNKVLGYSKFNEVIVYTKLTVRWKEALAIFRNAVKHLEPLNGSYSTSNNGESCIQNLTKKLKEAEETLAEAEQMLRGLEEAQVTLATRAHKTWQPVCTAMGQCAIPLLHLTTISKQTKSTKAIAEAAVSLAEASYAMSGLGTRALNSRASEGLLNWYRLTHIMLKEPENASRKNLEGRMSAWQLSSFKVLYEWWTASYEEAAHSLTAILFDILEGCDDLEAVSTEDGGLGRHDWECVMRHLEVKHWPEGDIEEWDEPMTLIYQIPMQNLFMAEFHKDAESEMLSRSEWCHILHHKRRDAVMRAYSRNLAWELCRHNLPPSAPVKPRVCSNLEAEAACSVAGPVFGDSATASLAKGPVVEPCPWLEQQREQDPENLPHFLWDTESCKTIETSGLDQYPIYTVISHTWGRWAKDEPPADIDGVPWAVPQNWRFEVLELPQTLKNIPSKTRYVWFDLLCIPQDFSVLGAKEISRQAQIFQGARYAIAWLNDVESLEGLGYAMAWEALQLMKFQHVGLETSRLSLIEEVWEMISDKPSGLLGGYNHDVSVVSKRSDFPPVRQRILNPWFTSLWTLQEVVLRPDMWLCAKDFSLATCDGVTPLPLSGIVAIWQLFRVYGDLVEQLDNLVSSRKAEKSHAAFEEVSSWAFLSGLEGLLSLDRVTILNLGDRRQCSGRRAEAIMSAIGTTKWYKEALKKTAPTDIAEFQVRLEQDLVLGKYPAEFVRELCESVPGTEFFNTVLKVSRGSLSPGSMLPFGTSTVNYVSMPPNEYPIYLGTHRSILTWSVLPTGRVHIQNACVVASSSDKVPLDGIHCQLIFGVPNSDAASFAGDYDGLDLLNRPDLAAAPEHYLETARKWLQQLELAVDSSNPDLGAWMQSQTHDTYLVLVSSYVLPYHKLLASGIVLQRLTPGSLVKTGHFFTSRGQDWIDATKVDQVGWIVD